EATSTLERAGFSVNVGAPVDSDLAPGTIAAQDPGAGQVSSGTSVTISPSNVQAAALPDVVGQKAKAAVDALHAAGFNNVSQHPSCNAEDAKVDAMSPAAGTAVNKTATVALTCK